MKKLASVREKHKQIYQFEVSKLRVGKAGNCNDQPEKMKGAMWLSTHLEDFGSC